MRVNKCLDYQQSEKMSLDEVWWRLFFCLDRSPKALQSRQQGLHQTSSNDIFYGDQTTLLKEETQLFGHPLFSHDWTRGKYLTAKNTLGAFPVWAKTCMIAQKKQPYSGDCNQIEASHLLFRGDSWQSIDPSVPWRRSAQTPFSTTVPIRDKLRTWGSGQTGPLRLPGLGGGTHFGGSFLGSKSFGTA